MTSSPLRLAGRVGLLAALAVAAPGGANADTLTLLDRPSGLGALPYDGAGVGGDALTGHALSADARYVAFAATADDLLTTDDDAGSHVYRLDRQTGAIVQADVAPSGAQTGVGQVASSATISADGRYVGFVSGAALDPAAPGGGAYVKDLQTGALTLASRADGADGAAIRATAAILSGDGRHVAFMSQSTSTAYLRALDTGATTTVGTDVVANGHRALDVAYDGRAVVFVSRAKLTAADTDDTADVYGWRAGGGGLVLVSRLAGVPAAEVTVSDDGVLAAWRDSGTNDILATGVSAGAVSVASNPQPGGTGGGYFPAFEHRGGALGAERLDFHSTRDVLTGDANGAGDLYSAEVAHLGDPAYTHLLTGAATGVDVRSAVAAAGGAVPVFTSYSSALPGGDDRATQLYDASAMGTPKVLSVAAGGTRPVNRAYGAFTERGAVSDDGTRVAFVSGAPALGAAASGTVVAVRDTRANTTTTVSVRADGTAGPSLVSHPGIDAAGRHVAFLSPDALVPGAGNAAHAYVRDLEAGTTMVADRTAAGAPADGPVGTLALAADGRHVAFTSGADDLPGSPKDARLHAYVVDLATGATVLADRADGAAGAIGNGHVSRVAVSGDGTRVAFTTAATNLGAGDPGGKQQTYVRDLATGTTTWVSRPADGDPGHAETTDPALDRAGATVAFTQRSTAFGHGMPATASSPQVFVTTVATGATELVSRGADGAPVSSAGPPSISADGTRVAFQRVDATSSEALLRDRAAGTTTLLSAGARGSVDDGVALRADGACAAYGARAQDLAGGYGPDFVHVYLRCLAPETQAPPPIGGPPPGTGQPPVVWPGTPPRGRDRTAPRITRAKLRPARFAVAKGRTAVRATATARPRGTTVAFRLSERATITIRIVRRAGAKRVVTLTRAKVRAGNVNVNYSGRTKSTVLKPGAYRAELTATDAAGNRSKVTRLAFTVVR